MFYRNTNLSNRTNETVGLYCLRSLKQQILQVQRIQPLGVWNLHDKININLDKHPVGKLSCFEF